MNDASTQILHGWRRVDEILRTRAAEQPERCAFRFSLSDEATEIDISYAELDQRARAVAAKLQALGAEGGRVLVALPPGPDFVSGFLGCLYAGATAVPALPPQSDVHVARVMLILGNADARVVLASAELFETPHFSQPLGQQFPGLARLAVEECTRDMAPRWRAPGAEACRAPAMLQHTSGSTGHPKGVILTHDNLLSNLETIRRAFGHDPERSRGVIWLPPYHDMGLIGGVLQPLYAGFPTLLLRPVTFLKRPFKWLDAISRFRGTTSGGPNFAFELCVRKINAEQRRKLDLESWDVAFCGAEPIQAKTLARFAEAFAASGFRRRAFLPCYGLAEATLMVSAARKLGGMTSTRIGASELSRNRVSRAGDGSSAVTLVSSGPPFSGQGLRIVDPDRQRPQPDGCVGEVWLSGPNISPGYFRDPEQTAATFGASLAGEEGTYLRTGDLGFVQDGELFITGRAKDLIVVRGVNHYPQDIEATVQSCDPGLRAGRGVAFSVDGEGTAAIVIVQEVEPELRELESVAVAVHRAVTEVHGCEPEDVVLVARGVLPTTPSGKLQRNAARVAYLEDRFLARARLPASFRALQDSAAWALAPAVPATARPGAGLPDLESASSIELWMLERFATRLRVVPSELHGDQSFSQLGVDSVTALQLISDLEDALDCVVPASILYEQRTIRGLAEYLAGRRRSEPVRRVSAPHNRVA